MSKNVCINGNRAGRNKICFSRGKIYCNYDSVFQNNEFDYAEILAWTGEGYEKWAWLVLSQL
jgi:hypothetical protein